MSNVSRSAVLCTTCRSMGILEDGEPCHVCEGPGSFHRFVFPIKIVAACDLDPVPDVLFQRMAVVSASRLGDQMVLSGITDRGLSLVACMALDRWAGATPSILIEQGKWY